MVQTGPAVCNAMRAPAAGGWSAACGWPPAAGQVSGAGQQALDERCLLRLLQTLCLDDVQQIVFGLNQVVVDHHIVKQIGLFDFVPRLVQPLGHHFGAVGAAPGQPFGQHRKRRRQNEDAACGRQQPADLCRTLGVDFQNHIQPLFGQLLEGGHAGAVIMAVHIGVLQKRTLADHAFEFGGADKVVVHAVLFGTARCARCVGHADTNPVVLFDQAADQGGFAGAGGGGNNENLAQSVHDEKQAVMR